MNFYYVNTNPQLNGDHEVHKDGCFWMPEPQNKKYLGYFSSCRDAVIEAKKTYPYTADGCHYCCPECDLR